MTGVVRAVVLALFASALWAGAAVAEPVSGPRETVDETFTTDQPAAPTGLGFTGRYHAAGDENGNPPYMRRMTFTFPPGMRVDTSVPGRCTATDVELEARGPDACPADSRIGEGTAEGLFYAPLTHSFVFDHYTHHVDVMNNADEQILLVQSEGWTVVRGHLQPDGSIEFNAPTCFPAPPSGDCADDYILQLASSTSIPEFTRPDGRSYATTPATCPASGYWEATIAFWWADGTSDSVASQQACAATL